MLCKRFLQFPSFCSSRSANKTQSVNLSSSKKRPKGKRTLLDCHEIRLNMAGGEGGKRIGSHYFILTG